MTTVRDYVPADERAWLRCRVLSFLDTSYFDDVATAKPHVSNGAELVAEVDGQIAGVLDLAVDGGLATIETIAVHPDHQRRGVGTALLQAAVARATALDATELDAWTRDDAGTLEWYRSAGFQESDHYLHVYADFYGDAEEPARAVSARPGLVPIKLFLHGRLEDEERLRQEFGRVHVCRRFLRRLDRRGD
jgi:ribosomal protein S18 acetylase RimI-like enzyme